MISKRKSKSHLIEKESLLIIKKLLPRYWTIREYKPDYGIDLAIELFDLRIIKGEKYYETLGEHIFVQVKGTEKIKCGKTAICNRKNVEKYKIENIDACDEIDVVKCVIDTNELYTIERMSNAVPVLLFVVDVNKEIIYFICLNDYIEKIVIPEDPNYYKKAHKTIYIPIKNQILGKEDDLLPIRFYAKRAKLYSFFNKVVYQNSEIEYFTEDELLNVYPHFLDILLRFDVWSIKNIWSILKIYYDYLINLKETGKPNMNWVSFKDYKDNDDGDDEIWETSFSYGKLYSKKQVLTFSEIRLLWQNLSNLYGIFEEYCREWFLPTCLNELLDNREV